MTPAGGDQVAVMTKAVEGYKPPTTFEDAADDLRFHAAMAEKAAHRGVPMAEYMAAAEVAEAAFEVLLSFCDAALSRAVAAERERCAAVCEVLAVDANDRLEWVGWMPDGHYRNAAAAIRLPPGAAT